MSENYIKTINDMLESINYINDNLFDETAKELCKDGTELLHFITPEKDSLRAYIKHIIEDMYAINSLRPYAKQCCNRKKLAVILFILAAAYLDDVCCNKG